MGLEIRTRKTSVTDIRSLIFGINKIPSNRGLMRYIIRTGDENVEFLIFSSMLAFELGSRLWADGNYEKNLYFFAIGKELSLFFLAYKNSNKKRLFPTQLLSPLFDTFDEPTFLQKSYFSYPPNI